MHSAGEIYWVGCVYQTDRQLIMLNHVKNRKPSHLLVDGQKVPGLNDLMQRLSFREQQASKFQTTSMPSDDIADSTADEDDRRLVSVRMSQMMRTTTSLSLLSHMCCLFQRSLSNTRRFNFIGKSHQNLKYGFHNGVLKLCSRLPPSLRQTTSLSTSTIVATRPNTSVSLTNCTMKHGSIDITYPSISILAGDDIIDLKISVMVEGNASTIWKNNR
ncbi:hypothetical protein PROFUN_13539 [Planoprotostelium fungivorum]|uniref:Uncharacterized protein n=1 Tax=Planoprotostelium fungivorum TaxID=1890364 RepID=A0A2P6N3R0_9EUKA|nr:hypothetical protein PROFUN_13539 [Planoprotostelium fungivorum]